MKFLIDECLSLELAKSARALGYAESSHVSWLGLAGKKDWELMPVIIGDDWTFVTRNSRDFRGHASAPGHGGLHSKESIHAGLICINGPQDMNIGMMSELFEVALDKLHSDPDMVNKVLEVSMLDDEIDVIRYELPEA